MFEDLTQPRDLRKRNLRRTKGGPCYYCGHPMDVPINVQWNIGGVPMAGLSSKASSRDHLIPTSRGGTDRWENIKLCCRKCNEEKGALTEAEYRAWKEGLANRLDGWWWTEVRRDNPELPIYPIIHYTRLWDTLQRWQDKRAKDQKNAPQEGVYWEEAGEIPPDAIKRIQGALNGNSKGSENGFGEGTDARPVEKKGQAGEAFQQDRSGSVSSECSPVEGAPSIPPASTGT